MRLALASIHEIRAALAAQVLAGRAPMGPQILWKAIPTGFTRTFANYLGASVEKFPLLVQRPSGGDRPQVLDETISHADVPVVKIDRRVAMTGD